MGDDVARIAAVRQAVGPGIAIRVDASGAWQDPEDALAALEPLATAGVELAEDLLADGDRLAELRRESPIAIAADAGRDLGAYDDADFVRLTVSGCGGITGVLDAAQAARRAGIRLYVASNHDGPLGVAAGVQVAAALLADGPLGACNLATLATFHEHAHMLPVDNGSIDVPSEPGLLGTTTQVK